MTKSIVTMYVLIEMNGSNHNDVIWIKFVHTYYIFVVL